MSAYALGIWRARYFWIHLALSDLRSRWRRSYLGILWTIIQPLGLTLLVSIVFGKIFHTDIGAYAPYILSGLIVWEFVVASATGGSLTFVQADAYIKQCAHPLAIYSLRTVLTNLICLTVASIALIAWVGISMPSNFGWCWLSAITLLPILLLIGWPLATTLGYIGARFRDLPHALGLVLQAFWFVSPIYFESKVFRNGGLSVLVDMNPIYHLLQIVRAPLLHGEWPTLENYAFCLGSIIVLTVVAVATGRRAEKTVIYYL
ncbi:ABC transporter permease [Bradyrhizobium sp. HKCCYLS2038]|uniref:ABC transporter permease n=1 Tax=unclassified Bradyrhizobium TaxID=2631580 RepID=UPI003EB7D42E